MLGGNSRTALGKWSRGCMDLSVSWVCGPKNARIVTDCRGDVPSNWNLVDTEFLLCPNGIPTSDSYLHRIVWHKYFMDWDLAIATKATSNVIQRDGVIELAGCMSEKWIFPLPKWDSDKQ